MALGSNTFRLGSVASAVVLVLAGCGGGGGGNNASGGATSGDTVSSPASLSGQSYKGPTAGATVCAYVIDNAAVDSKGAQVGCVTTANDGTFKLVLPTSASGDLIVESSGGTYCSDESVYDGTACAGGGTPIAMGAAKLRSVVATPASGIVADVPLTLLTTAAAGNAGALSAASFGTAYTTVAASFGLSGTTASTSPAEGALQSALATLATYLGGDTALLDGVVAGISSGSITASTGDVSAPAELACSPLAATDLSYTGMNMVPMPMGPGGGMVMVPMPYTYPAYGFGGACTNSSDGVSSIDSSYSVIGGMANLLGGTEFTGTYYEAQYTGHCGDSGRALVSSGNTPMTMQYGGTQAIVRSASADPLKAQEGTASKLRVTLQTGGTLGVTQATTRNHLFCRTQAANSSALNFQGYMTSVNSPEKDGSLSRIEGVTPFTGWSD
jgi:hypothetical protein